MSDYREFVHQVTRQEREGIPKDYWFLVTCDYSGIWVTVYDHPVEANHGEGISDWDAVGQSRTETYDNKLQVLLYDHDILSKGEGPEHHVLEDDLEHWVLDQEEGEEA